MPGTSAATDDGLVAGWQVKPGQSADVLIAETDLARTRREGWLLLRSDAHHDNAHADHALERRHLEEAIERDAAIMDIGDLFCVMQGRGDRRADPAAFREQFRLRYFDAVLREAADFYAPYAKNWLLMSSGNHETAVLKHREIDLTGSLVERLNERTGSCIHRGTYRGWIILRIYHSRANSRKCDTIRIAYHHGYGGGGPVTRGVIQTNRQAAYLPDADVCWNGHVHEAWLVEIPRQRITSQGRTYIDTAFHVRTPGYKDEYSRGDGWHVERGGPPKPLGAWWLRYFLERDAVRFEFIRARAA